MLHLVLKQMGGRCAQNSCDKNLGRKCLWLSCGYAKYENELYLKVLLLYNAEFVQFLRTGRLFLSERAPMPGTGVNPSY